ncbi:hypothetical protein [Capnocytophaga felis]|uniref:Uncharacterized protein n=1 Tax=Capnocytophaga felis TaxID=2267611 RepID=A0A5M4BAQ3_9FLAO|nr:hypothetical protein [Capnocytophaga felis]GET46664.1 hypothetical protein RCZ01_19660 [Capnocytophaga felis]GET48766.1 hypothetical protein RCZ02_15970 [Capnocytophaga felis]
MKRITLLSANHTDYHLGFEVQSPKPKFFSWDTTYEEIIASPLVEWDSPFDLDYEVYEYYYFKYPVRVGNLLFSKFEFRIDNPQRRDIAVQEYYANGDKQVEAFDFWQVHQQLEKHLTLDKSYEAYENLYSFFHKDGITFLVIYYGEPPHQYVFFNIINARKYPELITPIENEDNIQLTDFVLFPKDYIGIDTDYLKNEAVKRRPPLLTERFGNKAVLWKDEVNKQLGVSAGKFCNVFPLSDIKKVDIDRMLPAKGGGADTLRVYYKKRKYPTAILNTKEYDLDNYLPQLEKFFGRSIEVTGFYYNC